MTTRPFHAVEAHASRWSRTRGVTLVELVATIAITLVLALAIGILLNGGARAWGRVYDSAFSKKQTDAETIVATLDSIGRRSNRINYVLYHINQNVFTPVAADASQATQLLTGEAVEFRYWDVELNASDTNHLMDAGKTATAYALFYVTDGKLKVDYGAYPPGGVPAGGGARNTAGVTTMTLAQNVSASSTAGPFSHTAMSGTGQGCVRLNVTLTDPNTGTQTRVVTAALMRNLWPR
jgi:hypothetical protein